MTYEANEEKNQNNRKSLQASTRKTHDQAPVISTRKDRQGSREIKNGQKNAERRITRKDVDDGYKVWGIFMLQPHS